MATIYPRTSKNYPYIKQNKPHNPNDFFEHMSNNKILLMDLLKKESYNEIIKLMPEIYKYIDKDYDYTGSEMIHILRCDLYNFVIGVTSTDNINSYDIMISDLIIDKLLCYSIFIKDIEMLDLITTITNGIDLFAIRINTSYCHKISNDDTLCEMILKKMSLTIDTFHSFTLNLDNMTILKLYLDKGYKLDARHIIKIISTGNIGGVELMIKYDYIEQIQRTLDEYGCYTFLKKPHKWSDYNNMFNLFEYYNINFKHKLNDFLNLGIRENMIEMVIYCFEQLDDLDYDKIINVCSNCNNVDVLRYILKMGGDINVFDDIDISNCDLNVIDFLIENGYKISNDMLNNLLWNYYDDLENAKYLIELGADFESVVKKEHANIKNVNRSKYYYEDNYDSVFETLITNKFFDAFKYYVDNYFDIMRPELDRLFVISSANGYIDILKYLLGLGIEYDVYDNKAFIMACMFGHFDCVKFFLGLGLDVDNVKENLFDVVMAGCGYASNCYPKIYNDIAKDTNIFRNDYYCYGDRHLDILKMLLEYKIDIPTGNAFGKYIANVVDVQVMTYLIDNNFDINMDIFEKDKKTNLLEICVENNMIDVVEILLYDGVASQENIIIKNLEMSKLFERYGYIDPQKNEM